MTNLFPERRLPAFVQLRAGAVGAAPDTLAGRAVRLAPFAVVWVLVVPIALVLPGSDLDLGLLVMSTGMALVTGALLLSEPPPRGLQPWRAMSAITSVLAALLLREAGGGPDTGFGDVLLLLSPVWQGLYGRFVDMLVAVGIVAAGLAGPILFLDGYPAASEVPRALVIVLVAAMLGTLLSSLVRALDEHDDLIGRLGAMTYILHASDSPRGVVCDAVRQLAGAPMAVLFEADQGGLIATAMTGAGLPAPTDPPLEAPPGAAGALASGRLTFEHGEEADLAGNTSAAWPGRSRLHVPVGGPDAPVAVVTAAWPDTQTAPSHMVTEGLTLLGADGARAIERSDLMARLALQANRDGLTGLLNRRGWDRVLQNEILDANREHRPVTLALFDLDRFKQFNDRHGHLAGDDLLRDAAAAWSRELRGGDVLARWGGEEFAVLLPGASAEAAVRALDRLRRVTPRDQRFSAGVCSASGLPAEDLMARVDEALYRAKAAGRNRTMVAPAGDGAVDPAGEDEPQPGGVTPAPASRPGPPAPGGTSP